MVDFLLVWSFGLFRKINKHENTAKHEKRKQVGCREEGLLCSLILDLELESVLKGKGKPGDVVWVWVMDCNIVPLAFGYDDDGV
jgi:hypothetical protein